MKRKNEKVPGFDDIIFENRNKEYGAYDLRKKYIPAVFWSVLGACTIFSGIILASFSVEKDVNGNETKPLYVVAKLDPSLNKPLIKPPDVPLKKLNVEVPKYLAPDVVDKVDSNAKTMMANASLDTFHINRPVSDTSSGYKETAQVIPPDPEPVVTVEEMPVFPGGSEALLKFISDNLNYPAKAIESNIEGKVIIRFVVSTDGSVKRITLLRGVDPLLDEEAVRVISLLPKWKPGKNNGTPASVWFSVPVSFRLSHN